MSGVIGVVLPLVIGVTPAPVQPPPLPARAVPAAGPVSPRASTPARRGFYFRLGLGFGGALGSEKRASSARGSLDSWTLPAYELSVGGSPLPGVAFGMGVYGVRAPALGARAGSLLGTGPFLDVYPSPSLGFHVIGGLLYNAVWIGLTDATNDCSSSAACVNYSGSGFGLLSGVGYDASIGRSWSLGVLLRLQYASLHLATDDPGNEESMVSVTLPSVLVTATYY